MPKYRWKGEDIRVNKGKYGAQVHRDISEQCSEEHTGFSSCDEGYRANKVKTFPVDVRTSDKIMLDAFDECNSKSYQIRSKAITIVCTQLKQTHNPYFLQRHNDRLINIIRNALENKTPCEIDAAATLLSLVAIQLPDSDRSVQIFYEPLIAALNVEYVRFSTRFAVLHAIGILSFLYETDRHRIYIMLKGFKNTFAGKLIDSKATKIYYEWQRTAWTWTYLMTLTPTSSNKKPFFWPQVLQYIEKELKTPLRELKIGICVLSLDNWSLRVPYEMLSTVISASNITQNLARNEKLLTKLNMAQSTERSPFSLRLKDIPPDPSDGKLSSEACSSTTSAPARKRYDIEKLTEKLALATHKSTVERAKALSDICKELQVAPHDLLAEQRNVFLEIIIKGVKSSNEVEQLLAVRLATLTVLQLGLEERFCCEVTIVFANCLKHSSTSISTSALICTSLAFIELVDNDHDNRMFLEPKMNLFRQIFSGTQSKHHKTLKGNSTHELLTILRTKALEAWGLLLTLCSLEDVYTLVRDKIFDELTELMMNDSNAEIRIACGQLISLVIELGRLQQSKYFKQNMSDTCIAIREIINDRSSGKHKFQNSSLREVLKYVEDGWNPSFIVRFDHEVHELKTWSSIFKYQKFVRFIGPNAAAAHFSENERVRAIVPISPKSGLPFWCLQPSTQYKLSCAATKKSKTKQNRMDREVPKFGCL